MVCEWFCTSFHTEGGGGLGGMMHGQYPHKGISLGFQEAFIRVHTEVTNDVIRSEMMMDTIVTFLYV